MNVLPVIERELRAGARQTLTYSLRVLAVAALLVAAGFFWVTSDLGGGAGVDLFQLLHGTLVVAIWVLVPMLTADCISRERREGTLALLFLTPLRPASIVVAKALAQGLRAFTLWFAAWPVMTLPFILGGISWKEAFLSAVITFSSIGLALAAGLVASARCRNAMRALLSAALFAGLFLLLFCAGVYAIMMVIAILAHTPASVSGYVPDLDWIESGMRVAGNLDDVWGKELVQARWWAWSAAGFGVVAALSFLTSLLLVVVVTGGKVSAVWREEPPSARVVWLQRTFTTPVLFGNSFRRWMRWELRRNPVGWLERRTWSGRLVVWGWTAIVICVYTFLLVSWYPAAASFTTLQLILAWLLVLNIAVSAAGSFRRERETGVLELLLVSPLSEWQIIGGRLRGLWGKFFLPQALMIGLWFYCLAIWRGHEDDWAMPLFYGGTYATLPIVGLYYSLARRHFFPALLWTGLMGVLLPALLSLLAADTVYAYQAYWGAGWHRLLDRAHLAGFFNLALQAVLAIVFLWLLQHQLRRRKFAMA